MRILIIDDSIDDAALIGRVLTADSPDTETRTISTAIQFAEELAGGRFEIVLMEAKVQWADGLDLIATLKRVAPNRTLVLFTTRNDEAFLSAAVERGVDGFAIKSSSGYLGLPEVLRKARARSAQARFPSDALLRQLFEKTNLGFFQTTLDGRLLEANQAFVESMGFVPAESRSFNVIERMLPLSRRSEILDRLQRERAIHLPDVPLVPQDGKETRCSLRAVLITEGQAAPMVLGLVEVGPAPRTETTFIVGPAGEKSLKIANRALGAAHDLKEPLRTLLHYSDLLRTKYRDQLDADGSQYVAFLHDAATRMQAQVTRLFADSGEGVPAIQGSANGEAVLARVLENLRASIATARAQVTHDPLPVLPVGEDDLLQLLQNLIGNAVKYHGDEPPKVHVSTLQRGGEWLLSVEDDGIGITPEEVPRLFSMFERGRSAQKFAGHGIGLAICKNIVERYDGRIWASPSGTRGTTFFFTLPDARAGIEARPRTLSAVPRRPA